MLKNLLDYNSKENAWIRDHQEALMIGNLAVSIGWVVAVAVRIYKSNK